MVDFLFMEKFILSQSPMFMMASSGHPLTKALQQNLNLQTHLTTSISQYNPMKLYFSDISFLLYVERSLHLFFKRKPPSY